MFMMNQIVYVIYHIIEFFFNITKIWSVATLAAVNLKYCGYLLTN